MILSIFSCVICSSVKCLFKYFTFSFTELFVFSLLTFESPLYTRYKPIRYLLCNYFHPVMVCLFILVTVSFKEVFVIFMKSNSLFFLNKIDCSFGVIAKKYLPNTRSQRFSPMFSYRSFIILDFTLRSMIHFELVFAYGSKFIIFKYRDPIIPTPVV